MRAETRRCGEKFEAVSSRGGRRSGNWSAAVANRPIMGPGSASEVKCIKAEPRCRTVGWMAAPVVEHEHRVWPG